MERPRQLVTRDPAISLTHQSHNIQEKKHSRSYVRNPIDFNVFSRFKKI